MDNALQKYAVIGDPVAHSLSPLMHNAAFKALGISAEYSAIHVTPEELANFVNKARTDLSGFNITVPHKVAIFPFLDEVSNIAVVSKSVNTVSVKDNKLYGDSTDGYGISTAIMEHFGIPVENNSFTIIGAGGSATAMSFYFATMKAKNLFIINRTLATAEKLAKELSDKFPSQKIDCAQLGDKQNLMNFIQNSDVIIQTSSLGLKDGDSSPIRQEFFLPGKFYYDTIYKKTAFLTYAESAGCIYANGLSMLLHQGARSFEIWTGHKAPIEIMRIALEKK